MSKLIDSTRFQNGGWPDDRYGQRCHEKLDLNHVLGLILIKKHGKEGAVLPMKVVDEKENGNVRALPGPAPSVTIVPKYEDSDLVISLLTGDAKRYDSKPLERAISNILGGITPASRMVFEILKKINVATNKKVVRALLNGYGFVDNSVELSVAEMTNAVIVIEKLMEIHAVAIGKSTMSHTSNPVIAVNERNFVATFNVYKWYSADALVCAMMEDEKLKKEVVDLASDDKSWLIELLRNEVK